MSDRRPDLLDRFAGVSIRSILLHPALLFAIATMVLIGGAIQLWETYHEKIVEVNNFQLTEESVVVNTAEPEWAVSSIKDLLVQHYQANQSSILDTRLVAETAAVVRGFGWVESVERIEKSKAGVELDLTYRSPTAMVVLNDEELLPIDRNGVVMDGDLIDPSRASNFLRVSIYRPRSQGLATWQAWPDQRILDAAKLSEIVEGHWQSLGLCQIVTFQLPGNSMKKRPFELWTKNGTVVLWGSTPGQEEPGEGTPEMKLDALQEFVINNGPLRQFNRNPGRNQERILDVRNGRAVVRTRVRTALRDNQLEEMESRLR